MKFSTITSCSDKNRYYAMFNSKLTLSGLPNFTDLFAVSRIYIDLRECLVFYCSISSVVTHIMPKLFYNFHQHCYLKMY